MKISKKTKTTKFHRRDERLDECKECIYTPSQTCIFNNCSSSNSNNKEGCSSNNSTFCLDQLKVTAADYNDDNSSNSQTALIAGLTTGLVVTALIVVTIAGFVFYKRRQYIKNNNNDNNSNIFNKNNKIETPLQMPHYSQQDDEQYPDSPFIIGAQSLQIPHLPDPPPSLPNTRRSFYIPSNPSVSSFPNYDHHHTQHYHTPSIPKITRSSSLRLTKYDYYHYYYDNNNMSSSSSSSTNNSNHNLLLSSPSIAHLPSNNNSSKFDFYFCPPQHSQSSLQTSSTVGDGEITIYWNPGPRPLN